MSSGARSAAAPLYLFACLALGATAQHVLQNMMLQILGLAILAWAAAAPSDGPISRSGKQLLLIAMLAVGLVALQNVPLPTSLWTDEVRARVADDARLLGRPPTTSPLSLTPYESVSSLLAIIPPLAMFCALLRLGRYRVNWLVAALLAGTGCAIFVRGLELFEAPGALWYSHVQANRAGVVHFFLPGDQISDLLLVAAAFALAAVGGKRLRKGGQFARVGALIVIIGLLIMGLVLADRPVAYGLATPVVVASILATRQMGAPWRRVFLGLGVLSLIGSVAALSLSYVPAWANDRDSTTALQSRREIIDTTGSAISHFMPLGSGLGSFARVYPLFERADAVTARIVPHAYNDYAEIALELGLPGIALMVTFFVWWVAATRRAWSYDAGSIFARAASVATAAVLIHSAVDFPLRNSAIAVSFAMCLGLLAAPRNSTLTEGADLRPTRHVVIG